MEKHIEHVIVLVSNAEIRLLGVHVDAQGQLSLYLTDFAVATDDIAMLSVCGLDNGQIFLGGRDGNLYELEYEVRATIQSLDSLVLIVFCRLKRHGFDDDAVFGIIHEAVSRFSFRPFSTCLVWVCLR